jgi:hypothetical protein
MNIGDLILRILADGSKLTPAVQAEAKKAGDAGAKTLGESMSSSLKTAGVKAFGVAAAGAFGLATKGALELDKVQANFQAQTGLSAEAASHAADVINKVAGDNRLSLDEVSEAAIRVHNDMGLVGDAADAMTGKIAQFARVTGQNAGEAVSKLDDILDNWNLTADQAQGLLDKLIVSHQKYGGSIADNETTLAKLAPAMQAANFQVDDGIALLGLFGAKGLDSERAAAAFSKALTKVKSPEELKAAIKDIEDTKDSFERARKAAALFGAKAGAQLANALGGANLDDYKVSVEEAAGATEKAADVIDSSFAGRIAKAVSQAQAALRGFGKDLGPAVTAAASVGTLFASTGIFNGFGNKIGGAIAKGIGGSKAYAGEIAKAISLSAESGAVGSAMDKAGSAMGTKLGKAFGIAFAAVAVAEAVKTYFDVKNQLDSQSAALATQAEDFAQTATKEQLQAALATAQDQYKQLLTIRGAMLALPGVGAIANSTTDSSVAALEQTIKTLQASINAHGNAIGADTGSAVADGLQSSAPEVTQAVEQTLVTPFTDAQREILRKGHAVGASIPNSIVEGVHQRENVVSDALNGLIDLMKNTLGRQGRIARDIGILTGKELRDGLNSNREGVRQEAARVQEITAQELAHLVQQGGRVGKKAMDELQKGLHDKNPAVRAAAQRAQQIVDNALQATVKPAGDAGHAAGQAFAHNLTSAVSAAMVQARLTVAAAKHDYAHRAVGGSAMAGTPYVVNEAVRNSEIFVPGVNGRMVTSAQAAQAIQGAAGGGGDTFQIQIPVTGVLRAETPSELARVSREMIATGVTRSKRQRSRIEVPTRG